MKSEASWKSVLMRAVMLRAHLMRLACVLITMSCMILTGNVVRATGIAPLMREQLENRFMPSVAPLNVVLVSDAVAQAEQIRKAATKDTIAIIYNSDKMTTTGLVDLLASVSAAHNGARIGHMGIVAHGGPGEIHLGKNDDLNVATMRNQAAVLERMRFLLMKDVRLDLYSCSVAAGKIGKTFVDELAAITGAAVFASDNPVGTIPGADFFWE